MNDQDTNTNSGDWRDRIVDGALEETVGGDVPPNLTDCILVATSDETLAETISGDLTMASETTTASNPSKFWHWAVAASVLLNLTLAGALIKQGDRNSTLLARNDTLAEVDRTLVRDGNLVEDSNGDFDQLIDGVESIVEVDSWNDSDEDGDGKSDLSLMTQQSQGLVNELAGVTPRDQNDPLGLAQEDGGLAASAAPVAKPALEAKESLARNSRELSLGSIRGESLHSGVVVNGAVRRRSRLGDVDFAEPGARGGQTATGGVTRYYDSFGINGADGLASVDGRGRWRFDGGGRDYGYEGQYWGRSGEGKWGAGEWQGRADGEGSGPGASGDQYERIYENSFVPAIGGEAISTFSIDVDTASYANTRQMLFSGHAPPADAVRLEEFVNYFEYSYEPPSPESETPFSAHVETTACPWQPKHRLVRIGVKGREVAPEKRPLSNLVFLVDVSGSMQNPDKLPLVKQGLQKLAAELGENDRVAIVVYASQEGLVLPSTPGTEQEAILGSLENLTAGGSTAGGAGIRLAYQIAEDNFIEGGTNRVILCTDGDFNVGTTSTAELERLVEKRANESKVFLSVIGFGRGNLNDAMMEKITGIGNGNYYYADGEREAERIFVKGMTGMLVTIAKDVKIQVEFNPAKVAGYRLLGYENRMLETQDFNDDKKDAGEIGAGHTVTCLYEVVPMGEKVEAADIDDFKYQRPAGLTEAADTDELLTLKMRYKQPDEDKSSKLEWPVKDSGNQFGQATEDLKFAASVASFGMLLRGSEYAGDSTYAAILEIAGSSVGDDPEGERQEFLELVRAAKRLKGEVQPKDEVEKAAEPAAEETEETDAVDEETVAEEE